MQVLLSNKEFYYKMLYSSQSYQPTLFLFLFKISITLLIIEGLQSILYTKFFQKVSKIFTLLILHFFKKFHILLLSYYYLFALFIVCYFCFKAKNYHRINSVIIHLLYRKIYTFNQLYNLKFSIAALSIASPSE